MRGTTEVRVALAAVASLALALGDADARHATPVPAGNYAFVLADAASPGYTIPAGFGGFSWAKGGGGLTSGYFTPADTSLIGFMASLGSSGTFRVGGTPCKNSESSAITLSTIQSMYAFLQAAGIGWTQHVIWCLNMQATTYVDSDITYAEQEIVSLENTFGPGVVTYAIGNEPDSYYSSPAVFQAQWQAFYTKIQADIGATYPNMKFSGPEIASPVGSLGWVSAFGYAASGEVRLITEHFYTSGISSWTVANLMSQVVFEVGQFPIGFYQYAGKFVYADAEAVSPVPIRIDEIGTIVTGGGVAGVSNAAISADWVAYMAITLANAGWNGFDIGGVCYSANINAAINSANCAASPPTWFVYPEWAALPLVWGLVGDQVLPVVTTQSPGANVAVAGLLNPAGQVAFLIANMDTVNPVSIVPQSSAVWATATATVIGSTLPSDLTININGVQMSSATGQCVSSCPPTTFAKGGWVTIPAGGAALMVLQ